MENDKFYPGLIQNEDGASISPIMSDITIYHGDSNKSLSEVMEEQTQSINELKNSIDKLTSLLENAVYVQSKS